MAQGISYSGRVVSGANQSEQLWIAGCGFPADPQFGGWTLCVQNEGVEVGIGGSNFSDHGLLVLELAEPLRCELDGEDPVLIVGP